MSTLQNQQRQPPSVPKQLNGVLICPADTLPGAYELSIEVRDMSLQDVAAPLIVGKVLHAALAPSMPLAFSIALPATPAKTPGAYWGLRVHARLQSAPGSNKASPANTPTPLVRPGDLLLTQAVSTDAPPEQWAAIVLTQV